MAYFHGLMCHSLQVVDDVSSGALIIGVLIIIEMMTLFCSSSPGKPGSKHLTVLPDSRIFCLFSSSSFFLQQSNLKCVHYCWRRFKSGALLELEGIALMIGVLIIIRMMTLFCSRSLGSALVPINHSKTADLGNPDMNECRKSVPTLKLMQESPIVCTSNNDIK